MSATDELIMLLKSAGAKVTFDLARNNTHACERCGTMSTPRSLVDIGYYPDGNVITRPICADCQARCPNSDLENAIPLIQFRAFIKETFDRLERYPLTFGGDLNGVEAAWHMLSIVEDALDGRPVDTEPTAYAAIARKYKCGSWVISAKVEEEFKKAGADPQSVAASAELVRRLKEVRAMARAGSSR